MSYILIPSKFLPCTTPNFSFSLSPNFKSLSLSLMGNAISPCFHQTQNHSSIKLIFHGGTTRILKGKHIAGEIMFEFPDKMVCHSDSFFIGQPIQALDISDELFNGQTYFVVPIDFFPCGSLSVSSVAALGSSPRRVPMSFGGNPFEYIKGSNGRVLIKVSPEFITRLISRDYKEDETSVSASNSFLCSTPELQKHYDQLVGCRGQVWSPKLETISEYKVKYSPCRFIGLEWKQKEKEG